MIIAPTKIIPKTIAMMRVIDGFSSITQLLVLILSGLLTIFFVDTPNADHD